MVVIMEPLRDFAALMFKAGALTEEQYSEIAGELEGLERSAAPLGSVSRRTDREIGRSSRGRDATD